MKKTDQLLVIIFLLTIYGCGTYSFPSRSWFTETVKVENFTNHVKTQSPSINFQLTEKLKNKIVQNTQLHLSNDSADIEISGKITDYQSAPFSIGANNRAILNRLELKLLVKYINHTDNNQIITKDFISFVDYDAQKNLGDISDSLNKILVNEMVDNIYQEFFVNW